MTTDTAAVAAGLRGSDGARRVVFALAAIVAALGVYAPILYYMGLHWYVVEDYSHGFLIAPLALYFAW